MKCPQCLTENLDSVKFCKKCGQSLLSERLCDRCHHSNTIDSEFCIQCGQPLAKSVDPTMSSAAKTSSSPSLIPTSFANGRYVVKKFLGEGGKKKVYLAHDATLDRNVAFSLLAKLILVSPR